MRVDELQEGIVEEAPNVEDDLFRALDFLEQFSDLLGFASNRKLNRKMSKGLRKNIRGLCRAASEFVDEFSNLEE